MKKKEVFELQSENFLRKKKVLTRCIEKYLKDTEYKIVYSSIIEEKSSSQIGQDLNIKSNTVRQKLKRSIDKLNHKCVQLYPNKSTIILPFAFLLKFENSLIPKILEEESWQFVFERNVDYISQKTFALQVLLSLIFSDKNKNKFKYIHFLTNTFTKTGIATLIIGSTFVTGIVANTVYNINEKNSPKNLPQVAGVQEITNSKLPAANFQLRKDLAMGEVDQNIITRRIFETQEIAKAQEQTNINQELATRTPFIKASQKVAVIDLDDPNLIKEKPVTKPIPEDTGIEIPKPEEPVEEIPEDPTDPVNPPTDPIEPNPETPKPIIIKMSGNGCSANVSSNPEVDLTCTISSSYNEDSSKKRF